MQNDSHPSTDAIEGKRSAGGQYLWEIVLLVLLFFVHAGDPPPGINEAHYLCKAKNFWDPTWCSGDMFVTSGKAHVAFYCTIGWLTQFFSLPATAWIGRLIGWTVIAIALQRLSSIVVPIPYGSLLVAIVWIVGVEQADLAGEWIIGGIEAKVFAYAFVLLALSQIARRRWFWVWPLLGVASVFHVLVGGWSVIAAAVAFIGVEGLKWTNLRQQLVPLVIGGVTAMLGILPGLAMMRGVDPEIAREAASVYTYERISHHLYPAMFAVRRYVGHISILALLVVLAYPIRHQRHLQPLLWFTGGAVLIGIGGILIGILATNAPDLAAVLLRYYWFRLTDAIVPLTTGICLIAWMHPDCKSQRRPFIVGTVGLVAVLMFGSMFFERQRAMMPAACRQSLVSDDRTRARGPAYQVAVYRDWRRVCQWVRDNTNRDDVFLSPRNQQTFKWYANRAEVVNWKDVPQDAESLLEWRRRMAEVFPSRLGGSRVTIRYKTLREFRERYGVEYMLVDRRVVRGNLPLVQIYPGKFDENETFAVYRVP